MLVAKTIHVVEGLPVVIASGLVADPSLEIGPIEVRVIPLLILAVIPTQMDYSCYFYVNSSYF
jgi:hypothetical protein